jgi:hypothetical protein
MEVGLLKAEVGPSWVVATVGSPPSYGIRASRRQQRNRLSSTAARQLDFFTAVRGEDKQLTCEGRYEVSLESAADDGERVRRGRAGIKGQRAATKPSRPAQAADGTSRAAIRRRGRRVEKGRSGGCSR